MELLSPQIYMAFFYLTHFYCFLKYRLGIYFKTIILLPKSFVIISILRSIETITFSVIFSHLLAILFSVISIPLIVLFPRLKLFDTRHAFIIEYPITMSIAINMYNSGTPAFLP
jgi:hypothetical protein